MMLARMIGILGPIDMEMLSKGQETHKYFTDDYDLYNKNEVHVLSPSRITYIKMTCLPCYFTSSKHLL